MNPPRSQLRADVAALATPAGRMVGSPGHAEARRFLCTRMEELQLEPYGGAPDYPLRYEHGGAWQILAKHWHHTDGRIPARPPPI